jgi:mannose-1-phosphate guanylyltransferase
MTISFEKKPNQVTAKGFIAKGNFLEQRYVFCFKAGVFLEELQSFQPDVYEKSKIAWENNKRHN